MSHILLGVPLRTKTNKEVDKIESKYKAACYATLTPIETTTWEDAFALRRSQGCPAFLECQTELVDRWFFTYFSFWHAKTFLAQAAQVKAHMAAAERAKQAKRKRNADLAACRREIEYKRLQQWRVQHGLQPDPTQGPSWQSLGLHAQGPTCTPLTPSKKLKMEPVTVKTEIGNEGEACKSAHAKDVARSDSESETALDSLESEELEALLD